MALIVRKAQETIEKLTHHGIGFYTSGQLFLEEYYVLAMIGKAGLNTLHMYVLLSLRDKIGLKTHISFQGRQHKTLHRDCCCKYARVVWQ